MFPRLDLPGESTGPTVTDMHAGGEPVRILELSANLLKGDTLARRKIMNEFHDEIRTALMLEPRGHNEMYGAILSPADAGDPDPSPHVLFCHTSGYSTMCGHATLALGRYLYAREHNPDANGRYRLRTPCGAIEVAYDQNSTESVFESVPCHVHALDQVITVPDLGQVRGDVGYGGAFYFILPGKRVGLDISTGPVSEVARLARRLFTAAKQQLTIRSHVEADLQFLYGVILTDSAPQARASRNICLFGVNQIDRSPTGSGVGARLAIDYARGKTAVGVWRTFLGASMLGFEGQISAVSGQQIRTRIRGRTHFTGQTRMILEHDDPVRHGFRLD